ncbi:DUF4231 domain-containing protein [Vibrio campbellii]|uniref:DUF4231 domain-containing protein n=1 Tax=Vibrio campbellii TaxID=680 RepID=UPI002499E190|nr:DUF4231 domain-containing protein [Vibrio campbellii]
MTQPDSNIPTYSFLTEQIDNSISTLKSKVEKQKCKTRLINGASIALGALITLTIGLKVTGYENTQQNIALFLGALLTMVNGWGAVFDYRKLWIRQKSTLLDLYHLQNHLHYNISAGETSEETALDIFERYQEIWARDGNEWRNIIYKPQQKNKTTLQMDNE